MAAAEEPVGPPSAEEAVEGVLVVDKPSGPTSHDVVDRVRRAFGTRRVGHTGTLDPFATGVLAVCIGRATRLVRFLAEGPKEYRATVRLGFDTTTDDRMGEPRSAARAVRVEAAAVEAACAGLTGDLMQTPPFYSAKRSGGRRHYDLAREGKTVEPRAVPVTVHAIRLVALQEDRVDLEVRCSPGTYIRSIARDLGAALGTGGHLAELRRTLTSGFGLEDAVGWEDIGPAALPRIRAIRELLKDLPAVRVGPDGLRALRHGRALDRSLVGAGFPSAPVPRFRVLDEDGGLVALAVPRGFDPPTAGLPLEPVLHADVVLVGG